ncbi:MAG: glycosyltransferase family 4 protein [Myxococcota bacterium]
MVHPRLDRRGGAENVVLDISRGLRARGYAVSIATARFSASAWPDGAWDGLPVHRIEKRSDRLVPRAVRPRFRARRLASLARDADVVVAHNFPATLWVAGAWPPGAGPRRVWYCEEPPERLYAAETLPTLMAAGAAGAEAHPWADGAFVERRNYVAARRPKETVLDRRLDQAAVPRYDAIYGNSHFIADAVERVYGCAAQPLWCGVAVAESAPAPPADPPYVAWVTNPRLAKNPLGTLEAIRLAAVEAPDLQVRVVGFDASLRERVEQLGLGGHVTVLERLDDAAYADHIAAGRFLIYPSIDEPFGLVPIEAMARSRAVAASRLGGPGETVEEGVTGLCFDPLDPADIARVLLELWRDPERCDALGRAGRVRYEAEFTLERFLDRFEAALQPA